MLRLLPEISSLYLPFWSIHLHIFQNLSQFFPVLAVANTGSCVGPQNKIGHYSVSLTCPYPFHLPWPYSKVSATWNMFHWQFYIIVQLSWNFFGLLWKASRWWIYYYFSLLHTFKRDNWHVFWFDKNLTLAFYLTLLGRSFKLCMNITLLGVSQIIPDLMTLTMHGHRCVRLINCNFFLDSCPLELKRLLHTLKRPSTVCFVWLVCIGHN